MTVNRQTTSQCLGQVYYAPQGRQRYTFTPQRSHFEEVQDPHWEEIEITLKELDGSLVKFQSDSQCVIKLHLLKQKNTRRLQFEFSLGLHDFLDDFLGVGLFAG